jgi:hypothetical protein
MEPVVSSCVLFLPDEAPRLDNLPFSIPQMLVAWALHCPQMVTVNVEMETIRKPNAENGEDSTRLYACDLSRLPIRTENIISNLQVPKPALAHRRNDF